MYACSPKWRDDWISPSDAERILKMISEFFRRRYPRGFNRIGVNLGLHFTGGEPFLNFNLLLELVRLASNLKIPSLFVETNCFWCINDEVTEDRFSRLKEAGLNGILISANPFVIEQIPFDRIERAVKVGRRIFSENLIIYQSLFYEQMKRLGLKGAFSFEECLSVMCTKDPSGLYAGLSYPFLLPMGKAPYKIGYLYRRYPAKEFFGESCLEELTREWHVHIDNYITGYCAGISLGDARKLEEICREGIDLEEHPIIEKLTSPRGIGKLYDYASREHGYREVKDDYISKCYLCLDIRRHISEQTNEFKELKPREFYEYI